MTYEIALLIYALFATAIAMCFIAKWMQLLSEVTELRRHNNNLTIKRL